MKLLEDIDALLALLRQPLSRASASDGWTTATATKWRGIFEELRDHVANGRPTPAASIARAMDFDGIVGGELLERAAAISNALRAHP